MPSSSSRCRVSLPSRPTVLLLAPPIPSASTCEYLRVPTRWVCLVRSRSEAEGVRVPSCRLVAEAHCPAGGYSRVLTVFTGVSFATVPRAAIRACDAPAALPPVCRARAFTLRARMSDAVGCDAESTRPPVGGSEANMRLVRRAYNGHHAAWHAQGPTRRSTCRC
jgi:hypothetical protein